jgi:hypothetical protein
MTKPKPLPGLEMHSAATREQLRPICGTRSRFVTLELQYVTCQRCKDTIKKEKDQR